ncbi:PepSY domain-containing protein [Methylobacterium sp. ID0610]|uniref:PepSY domain-containing protein n=1 Tax=Methylobacterium carpenticola TaxID=3344827 RepID=UPI0036AF21D3
MRFSSLALAAALTAGSAGLALAAGRPGADWMPAEQVKAKLSAAGYESITALAADDERWEGEGYKNGRKLEFYADPRTGAIMYEQPDD